MKKKRNIIIAVIVLVVIVATIVSTNQKEYLGEAKLLSSLDAYARLNILEDETQIWEDGMRTTGDEGTYEWWYTDAEFEDGTTIVTVFFTKNGFDVPGEAHPLATITVTYPDGTTTNRTVSEDEGTVLNASTELCDIEIGTTSLKYIDGDYLLSFVDDGLEYEVLMESKLPMWRPDTGHWFFGDEEEDFFAWFVAQPSSYITGTLTIDGSTQTLVGTGYHDHNWGNIPMNEVINHWYWGRAKIGEYDIIACDIIAEEAYGNIRLPVMMIAKDGEIFEDDQSKTIVERSDTYQHAVTNKFMDNNITYTQPSDDGIVYTIEFKREKDIVTASMLDGLSQPTKLFAIIMGANPTYVRVLGEVNLTVNDNGVQETVESEGLWEQMFFGSNKEATINE